MSCFFLHCVNTLLFPILHDLYMILRFVFHYCQMIWIVAMFIDFLWCCILRMIVHCLLCLFLFALCVLILCIVVHIMLHCAPMIVHCLLWFCNVFIWFCIYLFTMIVHCVPMLVHWFYVFLNKNVPMIENCLLLLFFVCIVFK